jgi:hypothetical protein
MIEKSMLDGQYGTREHEILIGVWVIRKKVLLHILYTRIGYIGILVLMFRIVPRAGRR